MKVSKITAAEIAEYLRLDEGEYTEAELTVLINSATAFVRGYTGLDDDGIDEHDDFVIVIYILCQDMHDNRSMYVDKNNINKTVECILGMHSVNLLPSTDLGDGYD